VIRKEYVQRREPSQKKSRIRLFARLHSGAARAYWSISRERTYRPSAEMDEYIHVGHALGARAPFMGPATKVSSTLVHFGRNVRWSRRVDGIVARVRIASCVADGTGRQTDR